MKQIKIGEKYFDLDYASQTKEKFREQVRSVILVKVLHTTYEAVKEAFVDKLSWSIVDEEQEYDHSDYNLIGSILDNLDGSLIIKIGQQYSNEELLEQSVKQAKESITVLAGKENVTSKEVTELRAGIEQLYVASDTSVDTKINMINFCPDWISGNHTVGEIYKTTSDGIRQIWECIQSYDNEIYPNLIPTDPSWNTFHKPFHGTTPETALEYVAPTGAHDIYKIGEYMLYTDNKIYKCIKDTNFSPEEQSDAWEVYQEHTE